MEILKTKAELESKIKELGILDPGVRWETGGEHHPKSIELYKALSTIDIVFANDYFCWKAGGDGDNGETLMYEFDMIFELQSNGYIISDKAWR